MNDLDKLLIAKTNDMYRLCDKHCTPQFSYFLNEAEQALIKNEIGNKYGYNCCYFGGFTDAQRKVFGVFPEWQEAEYNSFPIRAVKVTKTYAKELTHRDFLGSVMSFGIEREQVGDIVIDDDTAYIFMILDMADYVAMNLKKIGNTGVKSSVVNINEINALPKAKFKIINAVAASKRLDAVVAAMLKISRKDSSSLILSQGVSVNHIPIKDTSFLLKEDDVISVRGHGRFVFLGVGNETRSQRIHIEIKKFI